MCAEDSKANIKSPQPKAKQTKKKGQPTLDQAKKITISITYVQRPPSIQHYGKQGVC